MVPGIGDEFTDAADDERELDGDPKNLKQKRRRRKKRKGRSKLEEDMEPLVFDDILSEAGEDRIFEKNMLELMAQFKMERSSGAVPEDQKFPTFKDSSSQLSFFSRDAILAEKRSIIGHGSESNCCGPAAAVAVSTQTTPVAEVADNLRLISDAADCGAEKESGSWEPHNPSLLDIQPRSQATVRPSQPLSWADLLKPISSRSPRVAAPSQTLWTSSVRPVAPSMVVRPPVSAKPKITVEEKEGLPLREFLMPDVAKRIELCSAAIKDTTEGEGQPEEKIVSPEVNELNITENDDITDVNAAIEEENNLFMDIDNCRASSITDLNIVEEEDSDCGSEVINMCNPLVFDTEQPLSDDGELQQADANLQAKEPHASEYHRCNLTAGRISPFDMRRLLDPKHTNFLTDIRSPDIKPNVLDEIGFLSNDSDEDVLPPAAPAFQTRSKLPLSEAAGSLYFYNSLCQLPNQQQQRNIEYVSPVALPYHAYQNNMWRQQQRFTASPTLNPLSQFWLPHGLRHNKAGSLPPGTTNQIDRGIHRSATGSLPFQLPAIVNAAPPLGHGSTTAASATAASATGDSACIPTSIDCTINSSPMPTWHECTTPHRHEMLIWQLQSLPREKTVSKGNMRLCLDAKFVIGKNSAASPECVVLLGLIGSMPVAVKRITLALYQPMKENFVKLIQSKYTQECLVKYLDYAEDDCYGYLGMELCDYNLDEYIHLFMKKQLNTLNADMTVLLRLSWQFLNGLHELHTSCNMLHRNLKSTNILISSQGKIKLSDYGLAPVTPDGMTLLYENRLGDNCWRPKECSTTSRTWVGRPSKVHYTIQSEILVAGMLLHYTLSGGCHPYGGNIFDIEMNISRGWLKWKNISSEANHLILQILLNEPRERPDMEVILRHPLFWSERKKFEFLAAVGSELINSINSDSAELMFSKLNTLTFQSITRDWHKFLDPKLLGLIYLDDIKVYGSTACDLLILMYHIQQSYNKLSAHQRSTLGSAHISLLSRFPHLVTHVYKVIRSSDWPSSTLIKSFVP